MARKQKHADAEMSVSQFKSQERKRIARRWHWGTFGHFWLVVFTLILAVAMLCVVILSQFLNGPSKAARAFLTQTLCQSSALQFLPDIFMLSEEVEQANSAGNVVTANEVTDVSLITVKAHEAKNYDTEAEEEQWDENGMRLEDVYGATYHGYMLIVRDPSRVIVGTCASSFSIDRSGLRVDEIMQRYDGIAGINAGAFYDVDGQGKGGQALGLVYSEGVFRNNSLGNGQYAFVAGFDNNDILHVGTYNKAEAEELGLRDACAFGPALVINGVPSVSDDKGLNPRTAIGQRADGAVLLLVIDGRQVNSAGATISDVIDVMMDYGAVNACNMDGGSSSIMYYGTEKVNDGMTVSVSRKMPTAWIVK